MKLKRLAALPGFNNIPLDQKFSPDGKHLAVSAQNQVLSLFARSGLEFSNISPSPGQVPGNKSEGLAYLPDGSELFVASNGSPGITRFARSGDTYSKVPFNGNIGAGYNVACSPDGQHVAALSTSGTNRLRVFKRVVSTGHPTGYDYEELVDVDVASSHGAGFEYSPDGNYLVIADTTPSLMIFKRVGDSYSILPSPSELPPATSHSASFSQDSNYLALSCHDTSVPFLVYERTGDTFVKLPDPTTKPTRSGREVRFLVGNRLMLFPYQSDPEVYQVGNGLVEHVETISVDDNRFAYGNAVDQSEAFFSLAVSTYKVYNTLYFDEEKASAWTYPLFGADGNLRVGEPTEITGDVPFPPLGSRGLAVIPPPGEVGPIYPSIVVQTTFIQVDSDSEIAVDQSAATYPYLYSFSSYPHFGTAGETRYDQHANGAIGMPLFSADGLVKWELDLSGAVTLAPFESRAVLEIDLIGVEGKLSFPMLSSDGSGNVPLAFMGDAEFPRLGSAVETDMPLWTSPEVVYAQFSGSAEAVNPLVLTPSDISFAPLSLSGLADVIVPDSYSIIGDARFRRPIVQGDGIVPFAGESHAVFPHVISDGFVAVPYVAEVSAGFGALVADGFVTTPYRIDANMRFPMFRASGIAGRPYKVDGGAVYPNFGMGVEARFHVKITGHFGFPVYRVKGKDFQSISAGGVSLSDAGDGLIVGVGFSLGQKHSMKIG